MEKRIIYFCLQLSLNIYLIYYYLMYIHRQSLIFFFDTQKHFLSIVMQNTDIFINPRQSVTFSNSIFHLEEK